MKHYFPYLFITTICLFGFSKETYASNCKITPENLKFCSDQVVCKWQTWGQGGDYGADVKRPFVILEAQKRGLSCAASAKSSIDMLQLAFNNLDRSERKKIQQTLKQLYFYFHKIDGSWGNKTKFALRQYNQKYLNSADLNIANNANILVSAVLRRISTEPKVTETPKVTEIPKAKEAQPQNSGKTYEVASGTGFYVSDIGHIITNHHVVDGCKEMKVQSKGRVFNTLRLADDRRNDLTLLKISQTPSYVFSLSKSSPYSLQEVIVAGFPFGDRVSSTLKFTQGIISAIAGLGNDYSQIQIDAALQPGNSGGPIMDEFGNIVGVAVAKLSLEKILKDYGVVPENTNFGVKASAVRNLMEGNGIEFKAPNETALSKKALSQIATDGTVYLTCWMTKVQIDQMKSKKLMFNSLE